MKVFFQIFWTILNDDIFSLDDLFTFISLNLFVHQKHIQKDYFKKSIFFISFKYFINLLVHFSRISRYCSYHFYFFSKFSRKFRDHYFQTFEAFRIYFLCNIDPRFYFWVFKIQKLIVFIFGISTLTIPILFIPFINPAHSPGLKI